MKTKTKSYNKTYGKQLTKREIKKQKVFYTILLIICFFLVGGYLEWLLTFEANAVTTDNTNFIEVIDYREPTQDEIDDLSDPKQEQVKIYQKEVKNDSSPIETSKTGTLNEVEQYIIEQSKKLGVDTDVALNVARCESRFNQLAKNGTSTAKGVYQFINKTWKGYCGGDVFNYKDNVDCFMVLFPKHPTWWECYNILY